MASQDPGHSEAPPLTYRRGSTEVVPEAKLGMNFMIFGVQKTIQKKGISKTSKHGDLTGKTWRV
jgi:hypothetical protein